MLAVVLVALGPHGPDAEAPALAKDTGVTAYEAGLVARGALPVLVKRTPDVELARAILGGLRGRGNEAVAFDESAVARDAAFAVKRFRFDDAGIAVTSDAETREVAWSSIVAIVRGTHVEQSTATTTERKSKLSIGRALVTGGLLTTKTVETTKTKQVESRDFVVFAFLRDGTTLRFAQSALHYEGLGAVQPSQIENFATLVQLLRARASAAAYDERLLSTRPNADVPLLAHAIALAATAR